MGGDVRSWDSLATEATAMGVLGVFCTFAAILWCVAASKAANGPSEGDILLVNTTTHRVVDGIGRERYCALSQY